MRDTIEYFGLINLLCNSLITISYDIQISEITTIELNLFFIIFVYKRFTISDLEKIIFSMNLCNFHVS